MSGYDNWKTTDPSIEGECPECGWDCRFGEHDEGCEHATWEPDYEAIASLTGE